nr:MAG TPA_asm: hypothetical protein [Caudoviricetes sp.]DAP73819.1 MAG TPA: hypothetical protein [Caudoviricetes sp.]
MRPEIITGPEKSDFYTERRFFMSDNNVDAGLVVILLVLVCIYMLSKVF